MKWIITYNNYIKEDLLDNDDYYIDNTFVFHTTTKENYEKIKQIGKLIPTDHTHGGVLYKKRLHFSIDKNAHIRMINTICDEKGYHKNDLVTLIINYPCKDNDDWYQIQYKNAKIDNNAGHDGWNYYTENEIPLDLVVEVITFDEFCKSGY